MKSVTVKNSYFRIKLQTTNNVSLSWYYRMIFKDNDKEDNGKEDNGKKEFEVTGKLKNGKSGYVNYDSIKKDINKEIFLNKSIGNTQVKTEFKKDKSGEVSSIAYYDLIPCGSDKYYRVHELALTTDITNEITADSEAILQEAGIQRKIILDISLSAGATYSIERSDGGQIMDKDLFKSNKIVFQDSEKREIRVPKNYYGKLLLKKGSKIIASLPLSQLDYKNAKHPIVFCLGQSRANKSNISTDKTIIYALETGEDLPLGEYNYKRIMNLDSETTKKVIHSFLNSVKFDGVLLPLATEAYQAMKENNRKFLYDSVVAPLIKKGESIKFYVKKSKTGKNLIVFTGYSGLRRHLNMTTIGANNAKVSMMSVTANIMAANGGSASLKAGVKATARGVPLGFLVVATFDVIEFWANEDPCKSWSDLFVSLGVDLGKTVIATAASIAAGAALAVALPAFATAGAVVVAGVTVGILVSFFLEHADANWTHTTQKAKNYFNAIGL